MKQAEAQTGPSIVRARRETTEVMPYYKYQLVDWQWADPTLLWRLMLGEEEGDGPAGAN